MRRTGCIAALAGLAPLAAAASGFDWSPAEGGWYEDEERGLRAEVDGLFAVDGVQYDSRNSRDSELRLDRALLGGSAGWRDTLASRVMFDLAGIDTRDGVWEAWASARHERIARFSAGLLPVAIGIEDSF